MWANSHDAVKNYENWFTTPSGKFAFERELKLYRHMVAGWRRRGHTLLDIGCGPGIFLQVFWESGFDVTGLDASPAMLAAARQKLGCRADLHLGHAEHLPFDDNQFDYAVLMTVLEFCKDKEMAVREAVRVAKKGVLVGFLNRFSLHYLMDVRRSGSADKKNTLRQADWLGSSQVLDLLVQAAGWRPHKSASVLAGPESTWKDRWYSRCLNYPILPAWVGAFAMTRFDLVNEAPFTPIYSMSTEPKPYAG
ncbi:MAG: class I SAM-dependent methyltransferase [Desulfovibrio sp.]|uniref:class I SAM-dependent methyltransferase n=1 Tax=Desulfovibrio sp. 7SRBS1 TaxID=3378064 RepID=UPI003B40B3D4